MEREKIKKRFAEIFDNTDPHVLIETWYERCHDEFYKCMDTIKSMVDKHFSLNAEKNPIVWLEAAYCFDGEKASIVNKMRDILGEIVPEVDNEVVEAFVDLEMLSEEDDCDECMCTSLYEKSTTFDFKNIDYMKFCISGVVGTEITGESVTLSYDMLSQFMFTMNTTSIDAWMRNYLSNKLYTAISERDAKKSDIACDMTLEVWDMKDDKQYPVAILHNAVVDSFVGGRGDKDGETTVTVSCDWFSIEAQDDDKVANYLRAQLSAVANSVYDGVKFDLPNDE